MRKGTEVAARALARFREKLTCFRLEAFDLVAAVRERAKAASGASAARLEKLAQQRLVTHLAVVVGVDVDDAVFVACSLSCERCHLGSAFAVALAACDRSFATSAAAANSLSSLAAGALASSTAFGIEQLFV